MPTITGTFNSDEMKTRTMTWASLGDDDVGDVLNLIAHHAPDYPDKTVQIIGTIWASATLVLQGSNDGTNWTTLHDPQGGDLSWTVGTSIIDVIAENPLFIRPSTSGGLGTTDVTVIIAMHSED